MIGCWLLDSSDPDVMYVNFFNDNFDVVKDV